MNALLGLLLVLAGADPEPMRFEELVQAATRAREAGDLERTLDLLRRARAMRPHHRLLHNEARVLEDLGRFREAAAALRGVIDDPETPEDLREADRQRLLGLDVELRSGHLDVARPSDASVHLDGEVFTVRRRAEPGTHHLEVRRGPVVQLLGVELADGTLTKLVFAFDAAERARRAVILVDRGAPPDASLVVDGELVRGLLGGSSGELWLAPGRHTLEITSAGASRAATVDVHAGSELVLAALFPPERAPHDATPEGRAHLSWTALGIAGAGLGLGVASVVLVAGASSDRDRITNATRRDDGTITGLTMREAEELEAGAASAARSGTIVAVGAVVCVTAAVVSWLVGAP
ncbi:hypothetical protein L6R52_29845 [Myxococcota bacterium]|nr:hypothetical protein [Myxococcota bacterium]